MIKPDKTGEKDASAQRFHKGRNGGVLMSGNPNRKVNSGGRPPKRFRNWCRKMLAKDYTTRNVRKILRAGDAKDMKGMMELLARYGYNDLTKQSDLKLKAGGELLDLLHEAALTTRKAKTPTRKGK